MKKKFNVDGMTCASCQSHVEHAVNGVEGVISCNVNLLNNNMEVDLNDDYVDGSIELAVKNAGYSAYLPNENEEIKVNKKDHSLLNLIVAFIFLILLMYISMGNMMWGWPLPSFMSMTGNKMGFALSQFILVLPICYIYRKFFINGFKMLFKRTPNMDSLIALGALASMLYGIFSLFMISYGYYLVSINDSNGMNIIESYHMNLYFESAGMILVLVSFGKYLEGLSKSKTTKAIEELVKLKPNNAIILKDGKEMLVDIKDVIKGDIVVVKPGQIVPVDGNVIKGNGSINESNITGESIPKYKSIGDKCYSSTILDTGYLEIEAINVGDDTSISQIIKLVEEASNSKAPISKLADKVSRIFVPLIMLISLLTFVINIICASVLGYNNPFEIALNFAITVVVIACPCALGLATPVAIMVGTGKGAKLGLLIRNAEVLENTSKITTIVFDKTGTLTNGKPVVTDFINLVNDDNELVLYSIEKTSNHPLAKSICEYFNKYNQLDVSDSIMIEGRGIKATINDDLYFVANLRILDDLNIVNEEVKNKALELENAGKTVLLLIKNNTINAIIALMDLLKDNSKELIRDLNHLGIKSIMLTGDNKSTANSLAGMLGIDSVYSEVLPSEKGNIIDEIKKTSNGLVAMVGDGVNDAIALTKSDIAISVSSGSDVAINSSDIILINNDLYDIVNVIKLSKRVLFTIKLCLFWAFFYNFICVLIATGFLYYFTGFKMMPMYGAIAMSISSVSVVLTALSINLFKTEERNNTNNTITLKVKGMMCHMCEKHVVDACMKNENVVSAVANYKRGKVVITTSGSINIEKIKEDIRKEDYKVK